MTAPVSDYPESSEPAPSEPAPEERPRLLINGEPVRPEDLGRGLSEALQQRLSVPAPASRPRRTPLLGHPRTSPRRRPPAFWVLVLALLVLAGGLAWWWLG